MPDATEFSSGCIVISRNSRRQKLLRACADRDVYRTHCALRLRATYSPAHVHSLSLLMLSTSRPPTPEYRPRIISRQWKSFAPLALTICSRLVVPQYHRGGPHCLESGPRGRPAPHRRLVPSRDSPTTSPRSKFQARSGPTKGGHAPLRQVRLSRLMQHEGRRGA